MRSWYGIIPVTSRPTHYIVAAVCYGYTHISTWIRSVSQQTPRHVHHAAVRTLMGSFSIHPTFRISSVSRRFLRFSRAIVFLRPQYLVPTFRWDKTPRSTTEYTDECLYVSCLLCARQLSRYSWNGKLAGFSAASCWCGVIWMWRY